MSANAEQERFENLMQRFLGGSEEAAEELLQLCSPEVFRVVRRRLARRSPRFDSVDVVQAVWASFFGHLDRRSQFTDPQDMIRYLAAMAANKVRKIQRDNFALQKRAADREVSLDADTGSLPGHSSTPSQMAMADEMWERLLAETPRSQQQILYWRLDGKSHSEIAAKLGVTERTVSRMMSRLQKRVSS